LGRFYEKLALGDFMNLTFKSVKKAGFTLIEVMIVMLIIAVLAAGAYLIYRNIFDGTKKSAISSNLHALSSAARLYASSNEHTPNSLGDLIPLLENSLTNNPPGAVYTLDPANYMIKAYFTLLDGSLYLTQREY
jgi:prepilin-type N-terminal cleavage/methylation domain-containing protein